MMSLQLPGDDIGFVVVGGGGGGGGGASNSAASAKYLGYNVDQRNYRQSAAPPYFSNQQNNYVTDSTQLYQQSQQTQHLQVQQHNNNSKMLPPTKESQPRHVTTSPFYPSPVSDSSLTMNSNGMGPVGESSGVNSLPPSASTTSSSTTSTQPSSAVAAGSQTNLAAARAQVATHCASATPPVDNNKSSIIGCDDFSAQYYYSTPSATAAGSTSSAYYNSQQPAQYAVASISPPDNYYLNQNHQHQQHQHQFVRSHFHSGGASTVIASGSVSNSNKDFLATTHDKPNSDNFEQHSRTSQQLPASLPATPTFYQHPPPLYEQYQQQSYELMSSNSATALPSRYTNGNVLASPRLMMVQHHPHGPASPRYFYSQNGSFANVYQPRQNVMVGSNNNTSQQQFLYPPPPQQQQYYMHQQSEVPYQEANQDLNPAAQQSKGGLLKQKPGRPATSKASSKSSQQPAGGLKRQISHDSTPYYNYSLIENQQQQNPSLSTAVSQNELAERLSKTSPCASKKSLSKKRRKRDPNEPNKPVSAYALFFRDTQAAIKGQKPDATFGEVSKMVAHLWDNLEPEKKLQYKRRTDDAKKEYLQNLAIYRARKLSVEPTTNASNDNVQSEQQIPLLLAAQHPLIHQQTVDQTIVPRPAVPVQPLVNYSPASRFAPPHQKLAPNSKNTTWSGNQPDFPAAYGYAQPHTQSNVVNGQGAFAQSYPQQHSTEPMYYHYPPQQQQQQQQFMLKDQPLPTTPRSPSSFVNNSTAATSGQAGFFNGSQSVMQTSGVNCSNRPEHFSERQQFQGFKQAPAAISTAQPAEADAGGIFVNSLANMGEDDEDDEEND